MAWVTWRQHRSQLVATARPAARARRRRVRHAPADSGRRSTATRSRPACRPPRRSGCDIIVPHFEGEFAGWVTAARVLAVLPVLAGLFVGAPLLARELEQGTYRFAWTQGDHAPPLASLEDRAPRSRRRCSPVRSRARSSCGGAVPSTRSRAGSAPSSFDVEGLVVPAYALYALALGVLAGLVFRRTVAAMTSTLVAFAATRFLVLEFVRPHFLTPLHRVVVATETGPGRRLGAEQHARRRRRPPDHGCTRGSRRPARDAGRDRPAHVHRHARLEARDLVPAGGRFWTFQLFEAGLFLALSAVIVVVTLWLVRRTPS